MLINSRNFKYKNWVDMKRLRFVIVLLAALVIAHGVSSTELLAQKAQVQPSKSLMVANSSKIYKVQDKEFVSLDEMLSMLEQHFDVTFLFKDEIVANKFVDLNIQVGEKTGEELSKIIHELGLTFTRVDEQTYVLLNQSPTIWEKGFLQEEVAGTVTDASTGETLPGVNVVVKGTSTGTSTNSEGQYELSVPSLEDTLVFSFIGYQTQEVPINGRTSIDVVMQTQAIAGEELVVVGYGAVRKEDLTGAVGSINSETITRTTIPDAAGALQGRVPGVNIEKVVGRPGSGYNITVRGMSSLTQGDRSPWAVVPWLSGSSSQIQESGPLFVIDGIPTNSGLTDLNPNDIQKIDVLKDASATAIYGSRGANGVIIVTTKRGREGRLTIQYEANAGIRTPTNLPDMMNGEEYVQWRTDLFEFQGRSTDRSNPEFFTAEEWDKIDSGNYTDWIDLIVRNDAMQFSNTVTASGGDADGTFSLSFGQLKEEGTVPGQDFNRYNVHMNIDRKFGEKWEAGGNLNLSHSVQNEGSYEILRSAFRLPPVADPYDENGEPKFIAFRNSFTTNPLFESTDDGEIREFRRYRAFGNIYLQLVEPIEGLTLRSQLSPQIIYNRRGAYYGQFAKNGGAGKMDNTWAWYSNTDNYGYVLDNQIEYQREFMGLHDFNIQVIQSIQYEQWEETFQAARSFAFNSKWYNLGAVPSENIETSDTDFLMRSLASFTGRLQYSYRDKYLLTATGRYDGSSRLSAGNKWAFFPSAAVAWRISEEDFMQGIDPVNDLKLRLSYGITGNDAVDIYGTQSNTANMNYDFGGVVSPSFYKNRLANKDLSWEKNYEINFGLDYGLFNSRINGAIDVYRRDSKDLIMQRQLPQTSGWGSIFDNIGWVRNTGIEISLNTFNIQTRNFSWTTGINFDTNKNEIVELFDAEEDDIGNRWFIGEPIRVNYDYEFDGIWQPDEADLAAQYGQIPGQVKVKDLNDDGIIDANDRTIIGQRTPKWSGSITNTLNYKNWDFSFYVYTRQGQQLFSTFVASFMAFEGDFKNVDVDYWTPENPSNKYPQPGNNGRFFNASRYRDVSFVRVGNISLGYTFPAKLLSKLNMSRLRLYATATNPLVFTSYQGFDPEWANQNTWGTATSFAAYQVGINLEF